MVTENIRELEHEYGFAKGACPLYGILFCLSLAAGSVGFAVVTGALFACSAFAWWLFWAGCRDYDRKQAAAPRCPEDNGDDRCILDAGHAGEHQAVDPVDGPYFWY